MPVALTALESPLADLVAEPTAPAPAFAAQGVILTPAVFRATQPEQAKAAPTLAMAAPPQLAAAEGPSRVKLALSVILWKGNQVRVKGTDPKTVKEYAELKQAGHEFPAIVAFFDGPDYHPAAGFH